jgi:hypothetical protein
MKKTPTPSSCPSRILYGRIHPLTIERLEPRIVYSVTFAGVPAWVDQGPAPINSGQVVAPVNNAVAGAIEAIAVDPVDPTNTVFVGTVAGGVWRTSNFANATPTWVPLSDNLESLYVGSVAFDPSNADTLYVGTGSYSNTFRNQLSQSAVGVYRTTNAHAADPADIVWEQLGEATFSGMAIRRVLPTSDPMVILVAADDGTNGGLFRSPDGGQTWNDLSDGLAGHLPNVARGSDVIVDPNNPLRLYAAAGSSGVFESNDRGLTWTRIDNINTAIAGVAGAGNIELAVHDAGATTVLYAGVVSSGGVLTGVFRDVQGGDGLDNNGINGVDDPGEHSWAAIGVAPAIHGGSQGFNNFSIVADPTNANVVYVGGDRPPELFRGDAGGGTWTSIVGAGTAGGTGPHADSRHMVFLDNTTLLESDDGGIFRLPNPLTANTSNWTNANGNLGNVEFHNIAYDTATNRIFGGSQDNGSEVQSAPGSTVWNRFLGGDGSAQAFDSVANVAYSLANNYGTFTRGFGATQLQLRAPAGVANFDGLDADDQAFATGSSFQSYLPIATNNITANELLFGRSSLYESTDNGDHITIIPLAGLAGSDTIRSIVYGGVHNGVADDDVFYVGTQDGDLYYRDDTGTVIDRTAALAAAVPAGFVKGIAVDPQDWFHVFATVNNTVVESIDAGATWTNITANLGTLTSEIRRVAVGDVTGAPGDGVPLVGGLGGVFRYLNGTWSEFGLMPNTLVHDLKFVNADPDGNAANGTGLLIAGTFGRGAWTIANLSSQVSVAGVLQITGDADFAGEDDIIKLTLDSANPQLLNIFINNPGPVPDKQVPLAAIQQINVNSLGGNDTLIFDSTNGLISVAVGTRYDGGTQHDTLQLLQTGGTQLSDLYSIGPNNGDGSSTITGATGVQLVEFQNIEPVLDLVPSPSLVVVGTAAANSIDYRAGVPAGTGAVLIDNFEPMIFSNKVALTIEALGGSDEISIHNDTVPTGLTGITVNAGDPTGSDKLILSGTSGADAFTLVPANLTDGMVTGVVLPVTYTGAEHLVLDGAVGNDVFNLDGSTGDVSLLGGAGADRVNFSAAAEAVIFDLDALGVAQRVTSTDALVTLVDRLENFTGTAFNDILYIDAAPFARDINGGLHTTFPPGDKFFFDGRGQVVTITKVDFNTGTVATKGYADVTFDEFETIAITNSPSGPGGFGPPGSNSDAFTTAHIYDPTTATIAGSPAPGRRPSAVATGDLNGDTFADMVLVNTNSKNLSILINKGDGTFFDPVNIPSGGFSPQDVIVGFIDGDANLDLAVSNKGSGNIAFFKGDGAGNFATPVLTLTPKFKPYALAADDINADGALDLVATSRSTSAVEVLLGNNTGTFAPSTPVKTVGKNPVDVVIADFNLDGNLDVATANFGSNNISFFVGNGLGGLAPAARFASGARPTGLAVGDLDNDGNPDLAVSNLFSRAVSVHLGVGNAALPQFEPQLKVAVPGTHLNTSIVVADFNGDGIADLGLGNTVGSTFTILLGSGLAAYTQLYEFDLGKDLSKALTGGIAVADLNNDGLLDIMASSFKSDDVRVLLRRA